MIHSDNRESLETFWFVPIVERVEDLLRKLGGETLLRKRKERRKGVAAIMAPSNSNESYCTFTLASDVTAGGLPSEEDIARDLESKDTAVRSERGSF